MDDYQEPDPVHRANEPERWLDPRPPTRSPARRERAQAPPHRDEDERPASDQPLRVAIDFASTYGAPPEDDATAPHRHLRRPLIQVRSKDYMRNLGSRLVAGDRRKSGKGHFTAIYATPPSRDFTAERKHQSWPWFMGHFELTLLGNQVRTEIGVRLLTPVFWPLMARNRGPLQPEGHGTGGSSGYEAALDGAKKQGRRVSATRCGDRCGRTRKPASPPSARMSVHHQFTAQNNHAHRRRMLIRPHIPQALLLPLLRDRIWS